MGGLKLIFDSCGLDRVAGRAPHGAVRLHPRRPLRQQKEVSEQVLARAGRFHRVAGNPKIKEVVVAGGRDIVCRNPDEARNGPNLVSRFGGHSADGAARTRTTGLGIDSSSFRPACQSGILLLGRPAE